MVTFYVWNDPFEFEIVTKEYYDSLDKDWQSGFVPIQRTQEEFDAFLSAKKIYREFRSHAVLDAHL